MLQLNPPLPTLPTLKPEADLWQDWERWNGPAKKSQPAIGAQQSVSNPHDASQDKKPEQKKQRYTVDMTPVHDSYKLSPGDSLMVRMNGEKLFGELNGGITIIAADGSVMFDKIYGPVKVGELTIEEAESAIRKRIREVWFNPEISIKYLENKKSLMKEADSEPHRFAEGDKLDIKISATPDGIEFHRQCEIVDKKLLSNDGKGNQMLPADWELTGLTIEEAKHKLLTSLRSRFVDGIGPIVSITLVSLKKREQNPPELKAINASAVEGKAVVVQVNEQPGGPWVGRLPGGVTVELLAVSDNDRWWQPNGLPLATSPNNLEPDGRQLPPVPDSMRRVFVAV